MAAMVFKLYRDPDDAATAITNLEQHGFAAHDIGAVVSSRAGSEKFSNATKTLAKNKSSAGDAVALGALAEPLKEGADLTQALIKALSINEEKGKYFEQGITLGGALILVNADEDKVARARDIMRKAESMPERKPATTSPGFYHASRMAATNPIDAPMSGDFRKY